MDKLATIGLLVGAMVTRSPLALADHIPGHNDSDPIFPMPIPVKSAQAACKPGKGLLVNEPLARLPCMGAD